MLKTIQGEFNFIHHQRLPPKQAAAYINNLFDALQGRPPFSSNSESTVLFELWPECFVRSGNRKRANKIIRPQLIKGDGKLYLPHVKLILPIDALVVYVVGDEITELPLTQAQRSE